MLNSKIITYDLRAPGRNYDNVYQYIQSYSVWGKLTESTWFINSPKSCIQIRDEIKRLVDYNDRIFVAELTGVAAWLNVIANENYLKTHL